MCNTPDRPILISGMLLIIICLIIVTLFSCNNKPVPDDKAALRAKNDSLRIEIMRLSSCIDTINMGMDVKK